MNTIEPAPPAAVQSTTVEGACPSARGNPVPEPPRGDTSAWLVPTRGSAAGAAIGLAGPRTTLGRHRGCDLVLDDPTISRHHAEIHHDEHDHYTLVDGGSLNGTYCNRHPIARAALAEGDEIWIGKARFRLYLPSPRPSAATAWEPSADGVGVGVHPLADVGQ